jgi:hypothetical protein
MEMEKVDAIQARLRILAFGGSDQAVIKYGAIAGLKTDWAIDQTPARWSDLVFAVLSAEAWMILNSWSST